MTDNPSLRAAPPILRVAGLGHAYGDNQILNDISFDVRAGEFVCIVGPSGAGKSTLLQCLTGLRRPTEGQISFQGQEVKETPRGMAVVFQDYSRSLMPWLTVAQNVELPLKSAGVPKGKRQDQAKASLEEVGLGHAVDSYPWQLSGGMQQRVAIARALAFNPSAIVMDEPFASVDAQTRADLEDLVLRVKDHLGIMVLLVTHDIDEAVYLSDRVLVLSGKPATLAENIVVDLPAQRDQLTTKMLPEFAATRARIFQQIRPGYIEPTAAHADAAS